MHNLCFTQPLGVRAHASLPLPTTGSFLDANQGFVSRAVLRERGYSENVCIERQLHAGLYYGAEAHLVTNMTLNGKSHLLVIGKASPFRVPAVDYAPSLHLQQMRLTHSCTAAVPRHMDGSLWQPDKPVLLGAGALYGLQRRRCENSATSTCSIGLSAECKPSRV